MKPQANSLRTMMCSRIGSWGLLKARGSRLWYRGGHLEKTVKGCRRNGAYGKRAGDDVRARARQVHRLGKPSLFSQHRGDVQALHHCNSCIIASTPFFILLIAAAQDKLLHHFLPVALSRISYFPSFLILEPLPSSRNDDIR